MLFRSWADPATDKMVKSKKWLKITPQTQLKVGSEVVHMQKMLFAKIVKIEGDKCYLRYEGDYAGERPTKMPRASMESLFLVKK